MPIPVTPIFAPEPERRFPWLIIAAAVFGLIALSFLLPRKEAALPQTGEQIAQNKAKIERCVKDRDVCIGGYVKLNIAGAKVMRIVLCKDECGFNDVSGINLATGLYRPERFAWIALPDESSWDEANREFGRQFLIKRRKK